MAEGQVVDGKGRAIDAAIHDLIHLVAEVEGSEFFHVHIILSGNEYRYEITKQFPKRRLKLAGPPNAGQERRARG